MCDVVDGVRVLSRFGEVYERTSAVRDMQERTPLTPISEYPDFVIEGAHEGKDIDDEIETHSRGVAEECTVPKNDGPPSRCRNGIQKLIRIDLRVSVSRDWSHWSVFRDLAWRFAVDGARRRKNESNTLRLCCFGEHLCRFEIHLIGKDWIQLSGRIV